MPVNMVSNLMHKNIIKVEVADGVEVMSPQVERVGAEENARAPVKAVAGEFAVPRSFLLASPGQQENRTQPGNVSRRHL